VNEGNAGLSLRHFHPGMSRRFVPCAGARYRRGPLTFDPIPWLNSGAILPMVIILRFCNEWCWICTLYRECWFLESHLDFTLSQASFSRTEVLIVLFRAPLRPAEVRSARGQCRNKNKIRQGLQYRTILFASGILVPIEVLPKIPHALIVESLTDDEGHIEDVGRESRASEWAANT
jgi:hypothetical protein